MDKSLKEKCFLVAFGVILFSVLMNFKLLVDILQNIGALIFPVVLGLILAFVLNVPMNGFQKKITRILNKAGKKINPKTANVISLFLTLLCILFVIVMAVWLLVPELVASVNSAYDMFRDKW